MSELVAKLLTQTAGEESAREESSTHSSRFQDLADQITHAGNELFDYACRWDALKVLHNGTYFPAFHQYLRAVNMLKSGRILVADWTGAGKTASAILTEILLREKEQRNIKTLVTAPLAAIQGPEAAWSPQNINQYHQLLGKPELNVVRIFCHHDLEKINAETDLITINDDKFSLTRKPQDNTYFQRLSQIPYDLIICDEAHREINRSSNRSKALGTLINELNPKAMRMLLTATPIRKDPGDLGMILHLLDPLVFPNPAMFDYQKNLESSRRVLHKYMYRLDRQELSRIFPLPEISPAIRYPLALDPDLEKKYIQVWADELDQKYSVIKNFWELRRILAQQKIRELCKESGLIDTLLKQGEQVAIYSELKEGVMDRLEYLFSSRYPREGIVRLDGDCSNFSKNQSRQSSDDRAYIAQKFRDGEARILLFTSVMGQGVQLHNNTAKNNSPISLIQLEPSMTPLADIQVPGRFDRIGQKQRISIYHLVVESEQLSKAMFSMVAAIEAKYDLTISSKFRGTSVDQDMYDIGGKRNQATSKVLELVELSELEQLLVGGEESCIAWSQAFNLLNLLPRENAQQTAIRIARRWNGVGVGKIEEVQKTKLWEKFVELYNHNWEYSASAHTARLIHKLTQGIEQIAGNLQTIVDAGSGAAYMSRVFERPTICVDISEDMLTIGKSEAEKKGINNTYLQKRIQSTSLDAKSIDLLICSYVLHYQKQDGQLREIEDTLLEFNRVLRPEGYLIISLPRKLDGKSYRLFNKGLEQYEFDLIPELSGYYEVRRCVEISSSGMSEKHPSQARFKGVYVTVAKKEGDCSAYSSPSHNFDLYNHKTRMFVGGKERITARRAESLPKRQLCLDFQRSGLGIDTLLKNYAARYNPKSKEASTEVANIPIVSGINN